MGARHRRAGFRVAPTVKRDAGDRHVHEGREGVSPETARVDERARLLHAARGLQPVARFRVEQRQLGERDEDVVRAAERPGEMRGREQVRRRVADRAEQGRRDAPRAESRSAATRCPGPGAATAKSASAQARSTPSGIISARAVATHGSIVALPSDSGMREDFPSASARKCWASAVRPIIERSKTR